MNTNPLLSMATAIDAITIRGQSATSSEEDLNSYLFRTFNGREGESTFIASRRCAYEAQLVAETFFGSTSDGSNKFVDLESVNDIIWKVPEGVSRRLSGESSLMHPSAAQILRMAAGYTERGGIYSASREQFDFSWLFEILDEIDSDLPSSSVPEQLRIGISRHISIMRSTLARDIVPVETIVQQLATLSGLLFAAAQSETDKKKVKKFILWAARVSAGVVVDIAIGIPVNTATNILMMALESGEADVSGDGSDGDLQDLGETISV